MQTHLVALSSHIVEDCFETGEGASTGCGYANEHIGRTFPSFDAMLQYLSDHYGLSADTKDYERGRGELYTSRTVANHSDAQNGGWLEPTGVEYADWRAGKTKLYAENYSIQFHYVR